MACLISHKGRTRYRLGPQLLPVHTMGTSDIRAYIAQHLFFFPLASMTVNTKAKSITVTARMEGDSAGESVPCTIRTVQSESH